MYDVCVPINLNESCWKWHLQAPPSLIGDPHFCCFYFRSRFDDELERFIELLQLHAWFSLIIGDVVAAVCMLHHCIKWEEITNRTSFAYWGMPPTFGSSKPNIWLLCRETRPDIMWRSIHFYCHLSTLYFVYINAKDIFILISMMDNNKKNFSDFGIFFSSSSFKHGFLLLYE